jgi:hypothetical protein
MEIYGLFVVTHLSENSCLFHHLRGITHTTEQTIGGHQDSVDCHILLDTLKEREEIITFTET